MLFRVLLFVSLLVPGLAFAQGGRVTSDPTLLSGSGRPIGGANVSVCAPVATTAAIANGTLLVFTMASNPITAGYKAGVTVLVAGFTGGDAVLNAGSLTGNVIVGGYTILAVSSSSVTVSTTLTRNAITNGTLLQMGSATVSCAGLVQLYTDATLSTITTNPIQTDGLGNYGAGIAAGLYYAQIYGPGIVTSLRQFVVSNISSFPGAIGPNQVAFATLANTLGGTANFQYIPASGGLLLSPSNVGPTNITGAAINITNSIGGGTTYFVKASDGSFAIRGDSLLITTHGELFWDLNSNLLLQGGSNSPTLFLNVAGSNTPAIAGNGSALLTLNGTGGGPHVFAVTNTTNASNCSVTIDPYLVGINFWGCTSGTASIAVNAIAGTPCTILLPTVSGTAGQSLVTGTPGGGNCQATWTNSPLSASLVTTAATTDNVTVTGMTASGHCTMTATNAAASGLAAVPYISNKTTNQITVTHSVTANANFDILCTPY